MPSMLQSLALRLFVPVSIALALASCQQPSATTSTSSSPTTTATTSSTASPTAIPASPKADASPKTTPSESASPKASPSESPKADAGKADAGKADAGKADADQSDKIKQLDSVIKENGEYKEMYEATEGVKYITLVSTETCKALNAGVPLNTLVAEFEKEFDKQKDSLPADKLTKLKEYTGFVVGGSVAVLCPEHKDKLK